MSSPRREYKYQKRAMLLQNQLNQENATIAYNRTRQLTSDAPLLEKLGKQEAGINTAFGENGTVSSASQSPQADGSSIPSPLGLVQADNARIANVNASVQNLIGLASTDAQIRKLDSETEANSIDNLTRNFLNLKRAGLLDSQTSKTFADAVHQKIVNKYAPEKLSAEASSASSKALLDHAESAAGPEMIKARYDNLIADTYARLAAGELSRKEAETEVRKWSLMKSEEIRNYASANESNSSASLNVENARGVALDNRLKTLTFDNKLVESFESAEQSKLKTVGMKLQNLPHSVSEHFTRSALFALERIQKGNGSAADYALVASQTAREYAQFANNEAKDWSKIILGALPMSSAGSAQTGERGSGYVVNSPYVPQY